MKTTTMETARTTVEDIRKVLTDTKKATQSLLRNAQLTQWEPVNFEKVGPVLKRFDLTANYKKARDDYKSDAREILRETEKLENELGNLAIDIERQAIKPAMAEASAKKLEEECGALDIPLQDLRKNCKILLEGQESLRNALSFSGLVALAKKDKKVDAEAIDQGLRFYRFATSHESNEGELTLQNCAAKANLIEKKFKEIEIKGLPGLAAAIVEHQIMSGLRSADQIKIYIEDFQAYPPAEIKEIEKLQKKFNQLREAEFLTLLGELPNAMAMVTKILTNLAGRAKALKQVEFLPLFLRNLDLLHKTINNGLLEELKQKVLANGSPLNPVTIAAEKTPIFFMGLKGLVRSLKLLLHSLSGQQSIKATDLQDKTIEILNSCEIYYGKSPADVQRLQSFLNEHLSGYGRPFPFDPVFQFMKGAILDYGARLEKFILGFKIAGRDAGDVAEPGGKPAQGGMTLGRLVQKIDVWVEHFRVY